jgi:hypothetical protein
MTDPEDRKQHEREIREAAGRLVVGLADELVRPLEEVRELLAEVVAKLDEHVASAKGPAALSYDDSKSVRESIASAYLKSASAARLACDLAVAVHGAGAVESTELNPLLEAALGLVRHRFSAATELFVDLGSLPPVAAAPGELVMGIARVLLFCAESTAAGGESAVSVRSRLGGGSRPVAVVAIAENGRGGDNLELARACAVLDRVAARLGGALIKTSEPGSGSTFELRLPVAT